MKLPSYVMLNLFCGDFSHKVSHETALQNGKIKKEIELSDTIHSYLTSSE